MRIISRRGNWIFPLMLHPLMVMKRYTSDSLFSVETLREDELEKKITGQILEEILSGKLDGGDEWMEFSFVVVLSCLS